MPVTITLSLVASLTLAVAPAPATVEPPSEPPPEAAESETIRLALPAEAEPAPPPPRLSTYEVDRRRGEVDRASAMIGAGSVITLAGVLMIVGAAVEAVRPDCKFELDECPADKRRAVAVGLGVGGAVLTIGGSVLLGVGIRRLNRARAGLAIDRSGGALVLSGRF